MESAVHVGRSTVKGDVSEEVFKLVVRKHKSEKLQLLSIKTFVIVNGYVLKKEIENYHWKLSCVQDAMLFSGKEFLETFRYYGRWYERDHHVERYPHPEICGVKIDGDEKKATASTTLFETQFTKRKMNCLLSKT